MLGIGVVGRDKDIAPHGGSEVLEFFGAEVVEGADHGGIRQEILGLLRSAALGHVYHAGDAVVEGQRYGGVDHELGADGVAKVDAGGFMAVEGDNDDDQVGGRANVGVERASDVGGAARGGDGVADGSRSVLGALDAARADPDGVARGRHAHGKAEALRTSAADEADRGHARSAHSSRPACKIDEPCGSAYVCNRGAAPPRDPRMFAPRGLAVCRSRSG